MADQQQRNPKRWQNLAIAAAGLIVLVLAGYALLHDTTPPESQTAVDELPDPTIAPPSPTPTQTPTPAEVATVAVLGDSYSTGTAEGGQGTAGWPALLAARLGADLDNVAVGESGYVDGTDFLSQAKKLSTEPNTTTGPEVVVVFGSHNDARFPSSQVRRATLATLRLLQAEQPQAKVVVVGPCWPTQPPLRGGSAARIAVRTAANKVGVTYVDPMADAWFSQDRGDLIGADGVHPNDAGHAYIEERMEEALALVGVPVPAS